MEPTRKESLKCTLPDMTLAIVARRLSSSPSLEQLIILECTAMLEGKKRDSNHAKKELQAEVRPQPTNSKVPCPRILEN